jgi:hypothetical protein
MFTCALRLFLASACFLPLPLQLHPNSPPLLTYSYMSSHKNLKQIACILPAIIILYLRQYLVRENRRRDALAASNATHVSHKGIVEDVDADGTRTHTVVDNNQLDLTDRENLEFRYVL